jgi:hypothetical protein
MNGSEESAIIHRAGPGDVEQILDLLAFYERPRSYFEPFYLKDPSYRSQHSWVTEGDGRLLARVRVFDRSIWVEWKDRGCASPASESDHHSQPAGPRPPGGRLL